jgi:phage tail-like protein
MATTLRTDPLRNFKFRVQILPKTTDTSNDNIARALTGIDEIGFAQVSGISVTNEVISYREGGMNTHPHKMVAQSDFAPVSFARGAFAGQDQMWKWQRFIHAWLGGGISGEEFAGNGSLGDGAYRCDIVVRVYDHPHTARAANGNANGLKYQYDGAPSSEVTPGNVKFGFKLFNAWPGSYALTDLNAGDNGILIQSMTVHHEGFYVAWDPEEAANLDKMP